jgi:hypothetical protein
MNQLKNQTKKTNSAKVFSLIMIALMFTSIARAQQAEDKSKRPSPPATATGKVGDATISIDYSSPSVKGRKIFGGLLPYGTLWRAGANEATIFQTDKDLKIAGKTLPAGKYSFFATPGKKKWDIFFNSETGQWGDKKGGAANMDSTKIVLTFSVRAKKLSLLQERLQYDVSAKGFGFRWEYSDIFIKVD